MSGLISEYVAAVNARDVKRMGDARENLIKFIATELRFAKSRVDLRSLLSPAQDAVAEWVTRSPFHPNAMFEEGAIDSISFLLASDPVQQIPVDVRNLVNDPVAMSLLHALKTHGEQNTEDLCHNAKVLRGWAHALHQLELLQLIFRVKAGGTMLHRATHKALVFLNLVESGLIA